MRAAILRRQNSQNHFAAPPIAYILEDLERKMASPTDSEKPSDAELGPSPRPGPPRSDQDWKSHAAPNPDEPVSSVSGLMQPTHAPALAPATCDGRPLARSLSRPIPPAGSQPVHSRFPSQPPPADHCCNGHSQRHHSGPSWPTEATGTSLERPRSPLCPPSCCKHESRTVHALFFVSPRGGGRLITRWSLKG